MITLAWELQSAQFLHQQLTESDQQKTAFVWEQQNLSFNEIIISWDAIRPQSGYYSIIVSLFTTEWSSWLDYAYWGASGQHTFSQHASHPSCKTYQDIVEVLKNVKATGFRVCVQAVDGASLSGIRGLHVCATDLEKHQMSFDKGSISQSIHLDVGGLSQMALPEEWKWRFCSPASVTAVINYLNPDVNLSVLSFAEQAYDAAFDIYGNWVLNTAQASHLLGHPWQCYVGRLTSFNQVLESLQNGFPVIVSIKGPLPGSAHPYQSGHLMVIKGYDPIEERVLCMDPAFPDNSSTHVSYALADFLTAWQRRGGIAYLMRANSSSPIESVGPAPS